jgi:hypothetical protein
MADGNFLATLADANSLLLGLSRPLTKSHEIPAPPLYQMSPIPGRLDPSLNALLTQPARRVIKPKQINQFPSEIYPHAPTRLDFIFGEPSRYIDRPPVVLSSSIAR